MMKPHSDSEPNMVVGVAGHNRNKMITAPQFRVFGPSVSVSIVRHPYISFRVSSLFMIDLASNHFQDFTCKRSNAIIYVPTRGEVNSTEGIQKQTNATLKQTIQKTIPIIISS
jgi:hypothetical protein